ncbi:hypothetical protein Pcinc_005549 [Petrolisthes cinctipes]|uniref:Uncharacterized protein n=1 Tax=Petrolisthes cinctipes TaxID=88211 RepID=A0AAE1KZ34_PETCI|nr:hypothetical protein Pcinc_005549 [Petrolisthes cinctipes]
MGSLRLRRILGSRQVHPTPDLGSSRDWGEVSLPDTTLIGFFLSPRVFDCLVHGAQVRSEDLHQRPLPLFPSCRVLVGRGVRPKGL